MYWQVPKHDTPRSKNTSVSGIGSETSTILPSTSHHRTHKCNTLENLAQTRLNRSHDQMDTQTKWVSHQLPTAKTTQAQVLVDFTVENTLRSPMPDHRQQEHLDPEIVWILYVDGSVGMDYQGASFVLKNLTGVKFTHALKYNFHTSNNESKYEALLACLGMA